MRSEISWIDNFAEDSVIFSHETFEKVDTVMGCSVPNMQPFSLFFLVWITQTKF